eukprot:SAG31_NODE_984_length_10552_cov_4.679231_3_plen_152_part_00
MHSAFSQPEQSKILSADVAPAVFRRCLAWTFVFSTCLLKNAVPYLEVSRQLRGATSGVKDPTECEDSLVTDRMVLLPSDEVLELHVFVDVGIAEGYFNGGRVAMTTPTSPYASGGCTGVLATSKGVTILAADAWEIGDISISEEELLRTLS